MQTREYKVSLIGPSEVGKSSFLKDYYMDIIIYMLRKKHWV